MLFEGHNCFSLQHLWASSSNRKKRQRYNYLADRVNSVLCSGHLKLISIDTCYLSADSRQDLIKCKMLTVRSQITHHTAISPFHIYVPPIVTLPNPLVLFSPTVMASPFNFVTLFNPRWWLVKINHSFSFTHFNCLARRLGLSQSRHCNI